MSREINRRAFVHQSLLASAGAAMALGTTAPGQAQEANRPTPQGTLPKGRIADLEISRLLLGGNLLTHFTHSRDLRYVYNLAKHYNTEEKIFETMALAEAQGINTLVIHTAPNVRELLNTYRNQRGGKIQAIVCPTADVNDGLAKYGQQVQQLIDDGIEAIYVWGVRADQLVSQGKLDVLGRLVEMVKAQGVPSGVGAHDLRVIQECEKAKVPADFYIKTLHHHKYPTGPRPDEITGPINEFPGYWCSNPEETIELMKTVEKPWLAFKVMAAGAIPPANAFTYAFQNGADFVLAGMFDFEIAEDVRIAKDVLAKLPQRARPWRA